MLNFFLGWTVGLGSLGFYLAGYLLPEVRRKKDAIWSGIGFIYALTLLTSGDRISGGLLVGQLASATLIGWFGWQTLQQRRDLSDALSQTPIPNSVQSIFPFLKQGWERLRATYTDSDNDEGDLLASGFKKVSALLGGQSDSAEPFNATSNRSKPETAPIHSEEPDNWADDQPSESSAQAAPVTSSSDASLPIVESAEHSADSPPTTVENMEAIASHQESALPEEPSVSSIDTAAFTVTSEVMPSIEEEIKVVEEIILAQSQTVSEEQMTSPIQEPDPQIDSSKPLSTSSSPTGEAENWPPQEPDDTDHRES